MRIHADLPPLRHGNPQNRLSTPAIFRRTPQTDVMQHSPHLATHSTANFTLRVRRWRCHCSIFAPKLLNPHNPRLACFLATWSLLWPLPRQGCLAALSPVPTHRCLELRNQFVSSPALWPHPGHLTRVLSSCPWKRDVTRPDGVALALSGRGMTAALLCGPVRVSARRSRGTGSRCVSRTIELHLAWPQHALTSAAL